MSLASESAGDDRDGVASRQRLLSPADVAAYLGVPLRTVCCWRSRGEGPRGFRIGRHLRFMLDDVDAWLEDRRDARAALEDPLPVREALSEPHSRSAMNLPSVLVIKSEEFR